MKQQSRLVLTIGREHVGKSMIEQGTCECCGTRRPPVFLGDVIGPVLPGDVGKRVFAVRVQDGGRVVLQVENDEQRDARLRMSR